ncbi:hypothetical protein [Mailhella sp.]|uniref:hypothetical protein n=1 Tax=Mailhella sp. TaxID=1981029 RepID=UPI003AB74B7A
MIAPFKSRTDDIPDNGSQHTLFSPADGLSVFFRANAFLTPILPRELSILEVTLECFSRASREASQRKRFS